MREREREREGKIILLSGLRPITTGVNISLGSSNSQGSSGGLKERERERERERESLKTKTFIYCTLGNTLCGKSVVCLSEDCTATI